MDRLRRLSKASNERGVTLVELMVSIVLSSLIVIATASVYVGSSRSRDTQDAAAQLQDTARFVTDVITKTIEQAGYQNYVSGRSLLREASAPVDAQPDIRGFNNSAGATDPRDSVHDCTSTCASSRVNNSDTLVVRFQGSSDVAGNPDGSMIDCLGVAQGTTTAIDDRLFSVFEVRQASATSEPELRCKRASGSGFDAQVIARGVESLQFMYGVDTNADSYIDKWMTAKQVDDIDTTNAVKAWGGVRAVRVGMVLRSANRVAQATTVATYKPLGDSFTLASGDTGSTFSVSANDGRLRRVVTFTVNLRNTIRSAL